MKAEPLPRPVLLYDRECRLCRFAVRCITRVDRDDELALLPLQDDAAVALLALPASERLETWRLARQDGSLVGYGAGVPALLETMGVTRPVGRLLRRVPERMLDGVYGLIARNRGFLGRLVPDRPAPRRFP